LKNKFSIISLLLAFASIICTIFLNYRLAKLYIAADGKTRALFGIVEISNYAYKIWVFIGGILALILAIIALKKKESKIIYRLSFLLSLITMLLVFIRFWKWMI